MFHSTLMYVVSTTLCHQFVHSIISLAIAGEKKITSTLSLPLKNDENFNKTYEFFTNFSNLSLLFCENSEDSTNCRELNAEDFITLWSKESKLAGGCDIPKNINGDETCKVFETTSTTDLFALNLHAINVVGIKMVLPSSRNRVSLPEYEITMLDNKLVATGPKPAVWLFDKLINSKSLHKQEDGDRQMTAFTRFIMVDERNDNGIVISANVRYKMCINMPSFATNVLPISVQALETKIGEVVERSVEREHEVGLKRFCDACIVSLSQPIQKLDKRELYPKLATSPLMKSSLSKKKSRNKINERGVYSNPLMRIPLLKKRSAKQ